MTDSRATFITNASMTRSELIERISRQYPKLTQADVASAVAVILDAITATLVANDRERIAMTERNSREMMIRPDFYSALSEEP